MNGKRAEESANGSGSAGLNCYANRHELWERIIAFNDKAPKGTKVTYWPARDKDGIIIFRNGKRTLVRAEARINNTDQCVVFLEGISGLVSINHVTIGSVVVSDSPCYDDKFNHLW